MPFQLREKTAVVTGASRGIGRSISLALADAGASLALISRSRDDLAKVAAEIEAKGSSAASYPCDITDWDAVDQAFKDIIAQHGAIHILVNNAGTRKDNLILRMSPEDWELPIRTNLTGAFYCTKAVIRTMIRQRYGRIINITSLVGITGNAGQSNYSASKAGLIGFTKSAARELASRGITVNAIAPGFITTRLTEDLSESARQYYKDSIALGRMGEPEDVAPAALFLASDEAGYITGQVLPVDGGLAI